MCIDFFCQLPISRFLPVNLSEIIRGFEIRTYDYDPNNSYAAWIPTVGDAGIRVYTVYCWEKKLALR